MWRLHQAARWLKYRFCSRALVLMYHRVTELPNDPYLLAVTPKHFAEHMEVVRRLGIPMRLQQLVEALRAANIPKRAMVVTFDDGYADNLHQAKPILERYGIPATVFVTASHAQSEREFWWDELDRLILQPGKLPARLRLNIKGTLHDWDLCQATTYSEDEYARDRTWHIERKEEPSFRQRLFRTLYTEMCGLTGEEREKLIDDLRQWARTGPLGRTTHQTLRIDELIRLQEGNLIEVGAHTMSHPFLARLPAAQQRNEILGSKVFLENVLNRPVTTFAFPHGSSSRETISILSEGGFVCACSSHPDVTTRAASVFQLPRLGVRNWDGETFDRWLRWWTGA